METTRPERLSSIVASSRLATGETVGHIRVEGLLGTGGMGEVYLGYDQKLRRRVAVKALASHRQSDPRSRKRLLREAQLLSRLDHPNVCRIYELAEDGGTDYLVLELIEGKSLAELIARGVERSHALRLAEQIAAALAAAHIRGIVHRDLKPGNVMVTASGDAKVLDFGLARAEEVYATPAHGEVLASASEGPGEGETALGALLGTPRYVSPEQARREAPTPAGDLYSLGLLLQELFTGSGAYPPDLWLPRSGPPLPRPSAACAASATRRAGAGTGPRRAWSPRRPSPAGSSTPSTCGASAARRWRRGSGRRRRGPSPSGCAASWKRSSST